MNVGAIISQQAGLLPSVGRPTAVPEQDQGPSFGEMVTNAIEKLDGVQKQADEAALQVATGQTADLHGALVTIEEANLSFQLALQVRNKLLEAYQEVMRIQV